MAPTAARAFVNSFNEQYAIKHLKFEEQFWGTKMALGDPKFSTDNLAATKKDLEDLLGDESVVQQATEFASSADKNDEEVNKILNIILKTMQVLPPKAKAIREATNKAEGELEMMRNNLKLGYKLEGKEFVELSSVGLRNMLRTSKEEAERKAAYEGLRSIGPFVCDNGFVEIVKQRNQLARELGYEDYYDYTVTNSEGFSKKRLFEILDTLETGTRPLMKTAREELERRHGKAALEPYNTSFFMAGSVIAKMDPYFPFSKSVERYMRSYAAMKISYQGATLNLDLLDRKNKYSNGFCHWPKPAWKKDGTWQPSTANFTSLADPSAVGSGLTALNTLMHEAGHASHFANVQQPSPLFSQERAPTSVAYAENQSMFLDSLVGDAAWRAKYALHGETNEPIPFEIIQEEIEATHPFAVFQLRAMLSVSYFEKALYELPDEEVTAEKIQSLADEIELDIQGGFSPRPLLSVPHLISDEASCYYQGYTLAEMSVHQTRQAFFAKDGYIVDNPNVGPALTEAYWKCGNSKAFLDIVKDFTGSELSGDAWTAALQESVQDKVARERKEYDESLAKEPVEFVEADLDMVVRFVDGDTVISDSSQVGLLGACSEFESFVRARVAATAESN